MRGALLVAGTSSDAGKSMIAAGLCRWLARRGISVAPFKAQNMSLNSFVTADGAQTGYQFRRRAAGIPRRDGRPGGSAPRHGDAGLSDRERPACRDARHPASRCHTGVGQAQAS